MKCKEIAYKILSEYLNKPVTTHPPNAGIRMTEVTHLYASLIPSSSPPVIASGMDESGIATPHIVRCI